MISLLHLSVVVLTSIYFLFLSQQPRPTFDSVTFPANPASSLLLCFDADIPMRNQVVPSRLPTLEQRGLVAPYQGHKDAVLDLKGLDLPTKMMLSCRYAKGSFVKAGEARVHH